jgi:hypothetical protein
MQAAGYTVRENDPFEHETPVILTARDRSPYVNRMRLMWEAMRGPVIESFPPAPGLPKDTKTYLKTVNDAYVRDAYHSLSIEGYRVSPDLIEKVRKGTWNPDTNAADREQRDALAARGYWLAFQAVQESLKQILKGENPADVADEDHASDLAGYRNGQVYIRRSMHVPPSREAVRDLMPVFFDLLRNETEPAVRVVLGHFTFAYIHPYMDGNGRIGRFLMNTMLAAGGWNWTVIPVEKRDAYMAALESASVRQDIKPFVNFLASLIKE